MVIFERQKQGDLHLNTLLVPAAWEIVEAEEEVYDFSVPDGILEQTEELYRKCRAE